METKEQLHAIAEKLGIGTYQRHVFLCIGPTCCTPEDGNAAWEALKQQIKDHNLGRGPTPAIAPKWAACASAREGPTMVVYPEGTWYHGMTAERMPRFVQQHLIEGQPIEEWIFAQGPLRNSPRTD